MESAFDLFTGSETGYLKGCVLSNKSSSPINKLDGPNKQLGITCMTWGDGGKTKLCVGCKNGEVYCYNIKDSSCVQLHKSQIDQMADQSSKVILRDLRISQEESNIILAFNNGLVKIGKYEELTTFDNDEMKSEFTEINAGSDLYCMDQCLHTKSLIATGGKKNPLKIWDITEPNNAPIFTAKNPKNDWLNLHVPVWVTQAKFLSNEKKIITATGHSEIRLYDPATSQRRPVLEMKFEETPITALSLRPGYENQVVVGNTLGNIALLDLRKKSIVKSFKGGRGGVTDIQFHPSRPYFATCGVDRFVNCYEINVYKEKKVPICSMYMQSALNCVQFTSNWSFDGSHVEEEKSKIVIAKDKDQAQQDEDEGIIDDIEEGNVEDLLGKMDVVKTKKRKLDEEKGKKKKMKS